MWLRSLINLALLTGCLATAGQTARRPRNSPTAFDGVYQTNPAPGPGNDAFEWWWFQVVGDVNPATGIVPSFEAIFYLGFAFSRSPTDPSYQVDVSGVFPNGTAFFISEPATITPVITTAGQAIFGNWGVANFSLSPNLNELALSFNMPGFSGWASLTRDRTPPHVPCTPSTDGSRFFNSLATGESLNPAETILYTETGWALVMPRAEGLVSVNVGNTHFGLTGHGYHDHNWGPTGLDQYAYTWLTGQGSCGPFDLGYLEVQALGSNRSHDVIQSSFAYCGEFLQSECNLYGTQSTHTVNITLTGQTVDPVTGQTVPTGLDLEYTLANGTQYLFTLTNSVDSPSQLPYHRWRLFGSGGRVGGPQYSCSMIGDWLNPGLATYTENGVNIFNQQSA